MLTVSDFYKCHGCYKCITSLHLQRYNKTEEIYIMTVRCESGSAEMMHSHQHTERLHCELHPHCANKMHTITERHVFSLKCIMLSS